MVLQIEPDQGRGDDTALNAIRLICANRFGKPTGKTIKSWESRWGFYRKERLCPKAGQTATFLTRFRLQMVLKFKKNCIHMKKDILNSWQVKLTKSL
jgi:hypothetical protein